jgi:hypothetical protein
MRLLLRLLLVLLPVPGLAAPTVTTPQAAIPQMGSPHAASPLGASPSGASQPQLCEAAIATTERAAHLPVHMMGAIALVESGRPDTTRGVMRPWPWTINAEGQGAFFDSKQQAIDAVRALQARGVHSIDVGCMQVNLMFHPTAFTSLDVAFDPDANTRYAAAFLTALHGATRDWPAAIAAYHSETPEIGAQYRHMVLARLGWPDAWSGTRRYADFGRPFSHYGDFLPKDKVYGAFANAIDALSLPYTRH